MSTALTTVAPLRALAPASVSEALIEQLLSARVRLERRAESFQGEAEERKASARREFADQAAQIVNAASQPLDARLAETLAARLKTVRDGEERFAAGVEALQQTLAALNWRIDAMKGRPQEREVLVRVLKRQYERLRLECAQRHDQAEELAEALRRIESDLDALGAAGTGEGGPDCEAAAAPPAAPAAPPPLAKARSRARKA